MYTDHQQVSVAGELLGSMAHHRLKVEHALAQVSRHLTRSTDIDLHQVLSILGQAFDAECVYLIIFAKATTGEPGAGIEKERVVVWHSAGKEAEERWLYSEACTRKPPRPAPAQPTGYRPWEETISGGVVPIVSEEEVLVGYLGVECTSQQCRLLSNDRHVMAVLSNLFASYFRRIEVDQALQEVEERWSKLAESHLESVCITIDGIIAYINEAGLRLLGGTQYADVLGCTLYDFVSAELYGMLERQQEAMKEGGVSRRIEHRLIRLDGTERIVESVSMPISFGGHPAVQTMLRDLTMQREHEERYSTLVRTISEAVWRIDLREHLVIDTSAPSQAEHILRDGFLLECNEAMAGLLGQHDPGRIAGLPVGVLLPNTLRHLVDEFIQSGYQLRNREVSLQIDEQHQRHFVINAVGVVEQGCLKSILGSCAEDTERVEVERRLVSALEEQQVQVGRDLHDGVGQLLTGIRMLSSDLAARYFDETDEGFKVAQKVAHFAEEASQHIHHIYRGLAPPQVYQESLAAALEDLAANMNGVADARCTFIHKGQADVLTGAVKLQLFRIAQEATNNALKHARAKNIRIKLINRPDAITLEVHDDGVGFEKKKNGNGLGLYSMQHRAHTINAEWSVDATPGGGTTVRCVLKVAR